MAVSGHRRTGGRREQSRERENAMVVVGVGKTVPVVVDGAAGRRWVVCRQTPAASGEANRGGFEQRTGEGDEVCTGRNERGVWDFDYFGF